MKRWVVTFLASTIVGLSSMVTFADSGYTGKSFVGGAQEQVYFFDNFQDPSGFYVRASCNPLYLGEVLTGSCLPSWHEGQSQGPTACEKAERAAALKANIRCHQKFRTCSEPQFQTGEFLIKNRKFCRSIAYIWGLN